jgi:hypothetical protein
MTTIVDAGSTGEANFHGFREYVAEPTRESARRSVRRFRQSMQPSMTWPTRIYRTRRRWRARRIEERLGWFNRSPGA